MYYIIVDNPAIVKIQLLLYLFSNFHKTYTINHVHTLRFNMSFTGYSAFQARAEV